VQYNINSNYQQHDDAGDCIFVQEKFLHVNIGILLQLKNSYGKNKSAMVFLLKLLILLGLLKLIFFFYNHTISNGWELEGFNNVLKIVGWSIFYDLLCISCIYVVFFLLLIVGKKLSHKKYFQQILPIPFGMITTVMLLLNTIDVFYFRFQMQRSNADLLYVFRDPLQYSNANIWWVVIITLLLATLCYRWVYKSLRTIISIQATKNNTTSLWALAALLLFLTATFATGSKKLLPSYPLAKLSSVQLPLVQNSLLNFVYSVYRIKESAIPSIAYMDAASLSKQFSIQQKNDSSNGPKNIVLFIMESVPLEFFSKSSPYKPRLPFLDSLVKKSTFYNNAFSYSYSSNKGITAILGGLPTLTDLPLYHSDFSNLAKTAPGKVLANKNYSSVFFIGDNYDNFGFAKCARWMGFGKYFSMEDIPGYKTMEQHTMGVHDEYVLKFMQQQLSILPEPFLAVQYNISTHYPNDVPTIFKKKYAAANITPPMLSMQYYDASLQTFFAKAQQQPWFKNSVFIFCSDHWAQPHEKVINIDKIDALRIPIFIYDPSKETGTTISTPVSQLDILNTVLFYGGYQQPFISYGKNLLAVDSNRVVFAKLNSSIYQAISRQYVLGFDASSGKAMYLYDYIVDPNKQQNKIADTIQPNQAVLLKQMKGFLQTATEHYKRKTVPE
jgi:phosphoglycerol transferase MdoB-like AlkP superfamily enzyme